MFGLMHIGHEVAQKQVLFLGPLGDLASEVVDATQKIETAYARSVEQTS